MENRYLNKIKQLKSLAKGICILQMMKNGWAGRLYAHSCCSALFSLYFLLQSCQRFFGPWWCTTGSAAVAGQVSLPSSSSLQHLQCWQWPSCWSWRGSQPSYTPCACTGTWSGPLELFPDQSLGGNRLREHVGTVLDMQWQCIGSLVAFGKWSEGDSSKGSSEIPASACSLEQPACSPAPVVVFSMWGKWQPAVLSQ